MWDSGVCQGAGFRDPAGNAILRAEVNAALGQRPWGSVRLADPEVPDRGGPMALGVG
jgi:hypothetical protein